MIKLTAKLKIVSSLFVLVLLMPVVASSQDILPEDNGIYSYHTSPRYRETESHPLRIAAYIVNPIGWVLREAIFRPLSYFASSTEVTRSVMGYREPFDYRQPECFSADDSIPDCRAHPPFNYDTGSGTGSGVGGGDTGTYAGDRQVYMPDVNFNFDKRVLNDLGRGRAHQIANLLNKAPGLHVVLEGHADYLGSDAYNEKLGMDRAEAVRTELVALGVSTDRLSTVTFGESQPVFSEQEDWARAVNRRVEVHPGGTAGK